MEKRLYNHRRVSKTKIRKMPPYIDTRAVVEEFVEVKLWSMRHGWCMRLHVRVAWVFWRTWLVCLKTTVSVDTTGDTCWIKQRLTIVWWWLCVAVTRIIRFATFYCCWIYTKERTNELQTISTVCCIFLIFRLPGWLLFLCHLKAYQLYCIRLTWRSTSKPFRFFFLWWMSSHITPTT